MGKHLVDFPLHPVAETVDGNEIRFLISGQPNIMNVTVKEISLLPNIDRVLDEKSKMLEKMPVIDFDST